MAYGVALIALSLAFVPRGALAAWGAADSALAATSAIAILGAGAALVLLARVRRLRAAHADARAREAAERARLGEELRAAGVALLRWPAGAKGSAALALGTLESDDGLDRLLQPGDRDALRTALSALADRGTEFRLACRSSEGGHYEALGAARPEGGHSLVLRDDSACQDRIDALDRSAAALRAEAHRLGAVLDALELPIWVRGETLALDWVNRAYGEAVDAPSADAVKAGGIELVANLGRGEHRQPAREACDTGETARRRRHVVVDGERRLFNIIETPEGSGGTIGWALDITDLEHAETNLKGHTEAHANVLEALNTAIAIYAANTRLTFFNSEFVKQFRLDERWLESEPTLGEVVDALREERRLPEQADWRAYKQRMLDLFTSVTEPQEELLHLPDGTTLRHIVSPHPFGGLLFMTQDVTDRFALERRHSTLTAVQRATLDNLHEAVAVFGADGRLKLSNPGYAEMWALDPKTIAEEPHIGDILDTIRSLISNGESWEGYRADQIAKISERTRSANRLERRDGRVYDCAHVPLPDGATLITYLDVTDSFQVERALRERTEALETADRLKSEFIANVSYELRTPLNTVIGFTEILANQYFGQLNERQQEYIDGILESSQYLLSLINDILDLATVEAGLMVLEIEDVEVHAVLMSMLGLVQERARKKQLNITFECSREIGRIEADERRVKQVIFNLLSNAIKFTPAGGTITLGARRNSDALSMWVADTGIGIDRDELHVVFDKFAQSNNTLSRQTGTGLGLSLVKNFVELHGGRVELDSAPQQGTTVTCHFPIRHEAEQASGEAVQ